MKMVVFLKRCVQQLLFVVIFGRQLFLILTLYDPCICGLFQSFRGFFIFKKIVHGNLMQNVLKNFGKGQTGKCIYKNVVLYT